MSNCREKREINKARQSSAPLINYQYYLNYSSKSIEANDPPLNNVDKNSNSVEQENVDKLSCQKTYKPKNNAFATNAAVSSSAKTSRDHNYNNIQHLLSNKMTDIHIKHFTDFKNIMVNAPQSLHNQNLSLNLNQNQPQPEPQPEPETGARTRT